jgi:hypothetical protein
MVVEKSGDRLRLPSEAARGGDAEIREVPCSRRNAPFVVGPVIHVMDHAQIDLGIREAEFFEWSKEGLRRMIRTGMWM